MLEQQMQELRDLPARVGALESQVLQLREEVQVGFSAIRSELREVRAGNEQTQSQMRLLHEDVISRMSTIREGR